MKEEKRRKKERKRGINSQRMNKREKEEGKEARVRAISCDHVEAL
jgi:hypothetical protein